MSTKPTLLLPDEYLHDATLAINQAKKRVVFTCMMLTDDLVTDKFVDALNKAALRGVKVEVAADVFTYGELSGHFIPTKYFTKKTRETNQMARNFKKNKVKFHWLGRFAYTPFTGRTHTKYCVVDDVVYSFGGVNLYDAGISNIDYMLKIKDTALADALDKEYDRLVQADQGRYASRSRYFDSPYGKVLVDGGIPMESLIYRRACQLASASSEVLYVSQYGPVGKLNRLLKKTNSHLYFNTTDQASPLSRLVIRLTLLLTRNKTLYKKDDYLHAKFMIFTMPDGTKIALTGSHNFANGGVILGTREIALETKDPAIIKQLEKFYQDYVA